jgi:hypothetical protein
MAVLGAQETECTALIDVLRGDGSVSIDDMLRHGIPRPGQAIYELELAGRRVERVYGRSASGRRMLLGYRIRVSRA